MKKIKPKAVKKVKKNLLTYHLYVKVNGEEHEIDTSNLFDAIMSFRPAVVVCGMVIRVTKGDKTRDKYISKQQDVKKLFWNPLTLQYIIQCLTIDL